MNNTNNTNGTHNYPVVISANAKTVTLGFTVNGTEKRVEVNKTMLKGMARWAAKRLQDNGASVPEYGTKESKDWAATLRTSAGM